MYIYESKQNISKVLVVLFTKNKNEFFPMEPQNNSFTTKKKESCYQIYS